MSIAGIFSVTESKSHKIFNFAGIKLRVKSYTELDKKINQNISKYKYIHIMYNNKFNKPFVDFLNSHFNPQEHMILCHRAYEDKEPTLFPRGENVYEYVHLDKINLNKENIDKIICHSLFPAGLVNKLYKEKNLLKKSYWVIWGGDLYNAPRDKKNDFVRKNFKKFAVETIPDINFYEQHYKDKKDYIKVMYIYPLKRGMLDIPKTSSDTIYVQINNSSDFSTLEILDTLSIYKNFNIKVRTILSYGCLEYKDEIIKKGKKIFGDKFEYLDTLLAPQEYAQYLSQNNILILNHSRQQGLGNTLASLYLGCKVFIKSDISTYIHLTNEGIKIYDTNKIKNMSFEEFVSNPQIIFEKNKKEVSKFYDENYLANLWNNLFINIDTKKYWHERVKKHGKRSVYNMRHQNNELNQIDLVQKEIYLNVLKKYLTNSESIALDFGCGPGRFSGMLADIVNSKVYAVDPIEDLLKLAPKHSKVLYQKLENNSLNIPDKSVDIIFVSLVLGGIVNDMDLQATINEFKRVAKDDALFFIVENTAKHPNSGYWHYRSYDEYKKLFNFLNLNLETTYTDCGEEISIMVGK